MRGERLRRRKEKGIEKEEGIEQGNKSKAFIPYQTDFTFCHYSSINWFKV